MKRAAQNSTKINIKMLLSNGLTNLASIEVEKNLTISSLKIILDREFNRKSENIMVIMKSDILKDSMKISEIQGFDQRMSPSLTLHAFFTNQKIHESKAFQHLNAIRILNQNAQNCTNASKLNKSPSNRQKITELIEPVSKRPRVQDFIKCTNEISDTLKDLSESMKQMANNLNLSNKNVVNHSRVDRMMRNNLDCCKYLAPMLKMYSMLQLPPGHINAKHELNVSECNWMLKK